MATTVLIVDNNADVRQAWQQLLLPFPDIEVVATACDGYEGVSFGVAAIAFAATGHS